MDAPQSAVGVTLMLVHCALLVIFAVSLLLVLTAIDALFGDFFKSVMKD